MLDACLRAAGYRFGLYTKPHLVNLTERTRIDGAEMPARADARVHQAAARRSTSAPDLALTFFEFTVALMFLYFAEADVDVAVIETGLGGRLDSTNVVRPLLSVITPIGFDHMEQARLHDRAIAGGKGRHHQAGRAGGDRRARSRGAPGPDVDRGPAAQRPAS